MIRSVKLSNWKAFENLQVDLPLGTCFIVAANGTGKTSLLQAIYFGLFGGRALLGSNSPIQQAIRPGAGIASVQIEAEVGGRLWTVERKVRAVQKGDAASQCTVTLDRKASTESAWESALVDESGVDLTQLRLLSAIEEGGTASEPSIDSRYSLVDHLSSVLGVTRLRERATQLREYSLETSRIADRDRLTLRDRPAREDAQDRTSLESQLLLLRDELAKDDAEFEALRMVKETSEQWRRFDSARAQVVAQTQEFLSEAREAMRDVRSLVESSFLDNAIEIGANAPVEDALRQISSVADHLAGRREECLERLGGVDVREKMEAAALTLVHDNSSTCPTCLRPLTEQEASRAEAEHAETLAALSQQRVALEALLRRLSQGLPALQRLTHWQAPVSQIAPPAEPRIEGDQKEVEFELSETSARRDLHRQELATLHARLDQIDDAEKRRRSDTALSSDLTARYRKADLALLGADTLAALADRICADQITPLEESLSKRWNELWPDRPSIRLDQTSGNIIASAGELELSFADLSGGERAVATVLLRVLALQAASRSPVLLLDEPLEHLDARNRRLLASLLVDASRPGLNPRQIIVTTYEESVTRRFSDDSDDSTRVLYVRSSTS